MKSAPGRLSSKTASELRRLARKVFRLKEVVRCPIRRCGEGQIGGLQRLSRRSPTAPDWPRGMRQTTAIRGGNGSLSPMPVLRFVHLLMRGLDRIDHPFAPWWRCTEPMAIRRAKRTNRAIIKWQFQWSHAAGVARQNRQFRTSTIQDLQRLTCTVRALYGVKPASWDT